MAIAKSKEQKAAIILDASLLKATASPNQGFMGMRELSKHIASIVTAAFSLAVTLAWPAQAHAVSVSYLYDLSDFTGPIRYGGARVIADKERNEVYVISGVVQVFNDNGMEIYRFNEGDTLGAIAGLAFDRDGTIFVLSYKKENSDSLSYEIIRCNFRGERIGTIEIKGVPSDFTDFAPGAMAYREGQFYLADAANLRIVVTDMNGQVQKSYDLIPLLELKESDRSDTQMSGFSVDAAGNMLFTVSVLFRAFVLSPDGKLAGFGQAGSLPGKFSIASDIIRDNRGNILVADRLKSVVNIYDKNFNFLMEFGGRGNAPGNIVVPWGLTLDGSDRLYVTQASNRGISVFRINYN